MINFVKCHKRLTIAITILTVLAILAFAIPYSMTDGTEKFEGLERQLAKDAIETPAPPKSDPLPHLPKLKFRVNKVYKLEPEKQCGSEAQGYGITYLVDIDELTFFGLKQNGYSSWVCVSDR